MIQRLGLLVFVLVALCWSAATWAAPRVVQIPVKGGIGPGVASFVERGILDASKANAQAIVLRIDTPGGLSQSMRDIIKAILSSSVPVIGYVAPGGAQAASAGTYILMATQVAAMAPGTNLGAATPVSMGGGKTNKKPAKPSAMEKKVLNDARAYMRSLGQLHGRNVAWLERAVTHGASISAKEALRKGVINIIAPSVQSLLNSVNGKRVQVGDQSVVLQTKGAIVTVVKPTFKDHFLAVISNPTVAYILLMAGVYGLFIEFFSPGMIAPGVLGAIALLLGLYGLQMLPLSFSGIGLIVLGLTLIVAEIFTSSFGILGIAGIVAFAFGSVLLVKPIDPGAPWPIPWTVVGIVTVVTGLFFFFVLRFAVKARHRQVVSGVRGMEKEIGIIGIDGEWVLVMGERWRYQSTQALKPGQRVRIVRVDGLTVHVEPVSNKEEKEV